MLGLVLGLEASRLGRIQALRLMVSPKGANSGSPCKHLQPSPPLASIPVTTLLNPTRAGAQLPRSRPAWGLQGWLREGMDAFLPSSSWGKGSL